MYKTLRFVIGFVQQAGQVGGGSSNHDKLSQGVTNIPYQASLTAQFLGYCSIIDVFKDLQSASAVEQRRRLLGDP
jgi:hypothetical protein